MDVCEAIGNTHIPWFRKPLDEHFQESLLEQTDHVSIDAEESCQALANHIQRLHLQYSTLLSLADQFYPQRTIMQLAHTAAKGYETMNLHLDRAAFRVLIDTVLG